MRTRRRGKLAALALLALLVLAGCTLPAPPGAAPLPDRDVIFSNLTTTPGLTYGSAPDASGNPVHSSQVGAAVAISADVPHSLASTYFDSSDSPILMFNGTADTVVPYANAVQTAADLYNAHVPIVFEPLEGAGHVPFSTYGNLMISQSVHFAYAVLDLAHAAGQPNSAARAFDA